MCELDRSAMESAIMDVKGDRLLLTLAIDVVESAATAAGERGDAANGGDLLTLQVDEEQLTALAHAHAADRQHPRPGADVLRRAEAMSPAQFRNRLDEVSAQVDCAADLLRTVEMAVQVFAPEERWAIGELLRAVAERLNTVAGALHDWPAEAE